MPSESSDHLANERTFLAWIRTSISVVVFGFVVAKFGITLRELLSVQNRSTQESGISLAIGLAFYALRDLSVSCSAAALSQYSQATRKWRL